MKNTKIEPRIRLKVLFLASWYPSRVAKVTGVFIKRKAECMAALCDVALLHVAADPSLTCSPYEMTCAVENGVLTVLVYFKPSANRLTAGLIYNFRFLMAHLKGWFAIKQHFGTPDIIHTNVIDRAGYIGYILSKLKKIPYVITEHSTPDIAFLRGEKPHPNIPLQWIKSIVIAAADAMNVDSQASLKFYQKAGFKGNFSVIPNVVEVDPQYVKSSHDNKSDKIVAVHISILIERKNVRDIITVFSQLYNEGYSNLEFHILGDGVQKEELRSLASSFGTLDKAIFFHGYVTDQEKMRILSSADMHILNSDEEGFSIVTAEAIACGVPVIATRCGGPEDFVTDETGILIDRRSPEQLRQAILTLIGSRMSFNPEKMHRFAEERFSNAAIAEKTYAMYHEAVRNWKAGNTGFRISIEPEWIVLDVGSGHQPHRRANILLDKFLGETIHRSTKVDDLSSGKQLVVGDALSMPFKDHSFDYIIASHIGEHVDDPVMFITELKRIAPRGYFETPGPVTEFFLPDDAHKWVVKRKKNSLHFRPNNFIHPPSNLFYRFFYLNREGYMLPVLRSNTLLLKILNRILLTLWKHLPHTYARIEWDQTMECTVDN